MRAHARFNRRFRAGALAFAAAVGVVIIPVSDAGPVSVEAAKPKPFDSNGKDDAFAVAQSREQGPVIGGATTRSTERTATAAEVIPGDPVQGTFGPQVAWPIMPIHAVLMPDGRVMSYGTDRNGVQTAYYDYDVWDPKLGTGAGAHQTLPNGSATDIFCSSQLMLLNGDVEMFGGDNLPASSNTSNREVTQYRPATNTVVRTGQLNRYRWYSSATTLPNAEILVQGGSGGEDFPEVRTADGSFRLLTGAPTSGMSSGYPKNFVGPDGKVFGLANEKMYRIDPAGTGSITSLGTFPTLNRGGTSTSVMFRPGKILQVGGGLGDSASKLASIIDINGSSPVVSPLPNAQFGRHWGNATVMADGRVLVSGGSAVNNAASGVAYTAEIFDPEAGTRTTADTATRMRLYHSTSLLLPDATVITMGGGTPGPETNLNAEIYYPPYLYNSDGTPAARPSIDFVANYAAPATSLAITTPDAASVGRVSLVKVGSVTHSLDMDQRFLDLTFTKSGTTVTASLPSNVNETPPGFYMVFVLNSAGVPSEAKFVRIGGDPPPPAGPKPVAAYGFSEGAGSTVADSSGSGNGGSIGSATWSTAGKYGNALSFNGTTSIVTIPDAPSLRLTPGKTLEAWVFPTAITNKWRDVIFKGDNYYLAATSSQSSRPATGGIFNGISRATYGTSALPANTWSHLAVTYDGARVRLYVNGQQVSSRAQTGALTTSNHPLEIGGDHIYGDQFTGRIDEVRVYNTALTATQIQTDMNTPVGGGDTQPPTVAMTAPAENAELHDVVTVTANANDNVGIAGVQFLVDGQPVGTEDSQAPYSYDWDTRALTNGAHTVAARARDGGGNLTTTPPRTVNIANAPNLPPVSAASANPTTGQAPLVVAFSSAGSTDPEGQSLTYSWNFGDGGTSTEQNPSHTYTGAGTYTARLTVSDGTQSSVSPPLSVSVTAAPPSGLVAAYGFSEGAGSTVADSSGSGNGGSIGSATWSTAGKYGNALSFNGTTSIVTIPDAPSLRLTPGKTLEAWVFPTAITNKWRDVIFKGDNYYLAATSSQSSRPATGGIFNGISRATYGTSALPANTWSHLAVTYDGARVRLYVNGQQVSSRAQTGALTTSNHPLEIGGDHIYGDQFTGRIDEVRVYNTALTATQIQTDMNTPVGG